MKNTFIILFLIIGLPLLSQSKEELYKNKDSILKNYLKQNPNSIYKNFKSPNSIKQSDGVLVKKSKDIVKYYILMADSKAPVIKMPNAFKNRPIKLKDITKIEK